MVGSEVELMTIEELINNINAHRDPDPDSERQKMKQDNQISNEFILEDRLQKIRQIINKYGEENFYLSFSGGKDSTVLSVLIDMALPDNKIPRVYANTGIEYRLIQEFVEREREREHPWKLVILKPSVPIKPTLEKWGYPFKSKKHSEVLKRYQDDKENIKLSVQHYLHISEDGVNWGRLHSCPAILRYQFTPEYSLKVSDLCCEKIKEEPLRNWQRENKKKYAIIGLMAAEGGRRETAKCLVFKKGNFKSFQPLAPISKEWEEWFIDKYGIELADIYKPPYNFGRTGCKGCPFTLKLQYQLDVMEEFFPNEREQCEIIWKPVYDEYRRLGYRLKSNDPEADQIPGQMTVEQWLGKENV